MAEKFTSYRATSPNSTGIITVVPQSGDSNATGDERTANSTTQVHAIYVSQVLPSHLQENQLEDNINFFHIGISDGINTFYIGHDIALVPQSAFYVEKTITLLPSQYLFIEFQAGAGKNGNSLYRVDAVACAVDLA